MPMTSKDFEQLAEYIRFRGFSSLEEKRAFIYNLMPFLKKQNPSFSEERFIAACRIDLSKRYK